MYKYEVAGLAIGIELNENLGSGFASRTRAEAGPRRPRIQTHRRTCCAPI